MDVLSALLSGSVGEIATARRLSHVPVLLVSNLGSLGVRFVATVIVARGLGPPAAGAYAAIATAIEIGDRALAAGRPDSIAFHVSLGADPGPMLKDAFRFFRGRLWWSSLGGVCLAILPAFNSIGWSARACAALVVATLPLTASRKSCWREARLASGDSSRVATSELLRAAVTLGFGIVAVVLHGALGLNGSATILIAGLGLSEVFSGLWVRVPQPVQLALEIPKGFHSYSRSAYFASLAQPLNQRVDQLLLLFVVPVAALGLYATAVSLSLIVGSLGVAVAQAVYPRLSERSYSEGAAKSVALRLGTILLCLIVPIAALVIVLTPRIVSVAFGEEFTGAIASTRILVVGAVLTSLNILGQVSLLAMGLPKKASGAQLVGLLVQATVLLPLSLRFGIEGAAVGSLVGYSARLGLTLSGLRSASNFKS